MYDDRSDSGVSPDNTTNRQSPTNMTMSRETVWFLSGRSAPGEPVRHVPIHSSPFVVGRKTNIELSLSSGTVSSIHAELAERDGALMLRDLGSTNGTYVNGERVTREVELRPDDIVQFANLPFRVLRQSAVTSTATACEDVYDQAMALVQFDRLMSEDAIVPHYQPIVDLNEGRTIGLEVLARSRIAGLEMPSAMFSAAAQLDFETRLSQMVRWQAIQQTMSLATPPHLFINTHPSELRETGLIESITELRERCPRQPLTLEIHEAAATDAAKLRSLRESLRSMNVGLAFDDFGSGQARLVELSEVHPDYLKFDMALIRSIDTAPADHVQMVATLVRMVREMAITPLAEGIETTEECEACRELGFMLGQGFYLGKPFPLREDHSVASRDTSKGSLMRQDTAILKDQQ